MQITTITKQQFINGDFKMNNLVLLSDLLEDFCTKHNIPFMSADDIITAHIYAEIPSLTQYQQNWLGNYIKLWEATNGGEDL